MALKEQLFNDLKDAMKTKDTLRRDVIQIVRASILQIEKDNKIVLDDDGVLDVLTKEMKKRYDVLPDYERNGRPDAVDDILRQIEIIKNYLPEQLSESEIEEIVSAAAIEAGAASMKDMGKVMAVVTPKVKGKADNKLVAELVKKKIQN